MSVVCVCVHYSNEYLLIKSERKQSYMLLRYKHKHFIKTINIVCS